MKQLVSIKVVQFFLFEKLDLQIGDICGIFGPNGSGKSSLLDAVQIAMFGANTRLASFNAQADEHMSNTRSVRGYCLGQYGESIEDRVRDRATTYITLLWRDTETREPVSMGVCLYAGIEGEGHEVLGRYLLRGVELSMGDHLDLIDGQERPREWAAFRHQLQERAKVSGEDPLFRDSDRYMRAVLVALRGSSVPLTDAFARAFRFALRMRFDRPVDQIVRNQVLEARPTNIKKFKEVTESFKRLSVLVADVERKISEGEKVEENFLKAERQAARAVTWHALGCSVAEDQAVERLQAAEAGFRDAEAALKTTSEKVIETERRQKHAQDEAARFKQLREAHEAHAEAGTLQSEIAKQRLETTAKGREFSAAVSILRQRMQAAATSEYIAGAKDVLSSSEKALTAVTPGTKRDEAVRLLRPALKAISSALNELFRVRRQIENDLDQADKDLQDAKENLERSKKGRAPLEEHVQRLMRALKDKGLNPIPVCDLVRVTDPEWQPVIESYLAGNVQALLVPTGEEVDAFGIYRRLTGKEAVYGAKIARESRYLATRSPVAGSVAELIEGTNPAAVNFLRSKFGNAKRADTDEEALESPHALTKDGMLVAGGDIDRLRLGGQQRVGGGSTNQHAELMRRVADLDKELVRLAQRSAAAKAVFESLQLFGGEETTIKSMMAVYDAHSAAQQNLDSLTLRLSNTVSAEYVRLGEEENKWSQQFSTETNLLTTHAQEKGRAEQNKATCLTQRDSAAEDVTRAAAVTKEAQAVFGYDAEFAAKSGNALRSQLNGQLQAMAKHCADQEKARRDGMVQAANAGSRALGEFIANHREHAEQAALADWRKAWQWLRDLLQRLRDTTLRDYQEQMEEAYRTSQATFRNDVALALHENLKWLEGTQDRLNEVLRNCPVFSNGERYQFKRTVRRTHEGLLNYIRRVADSGVGDEVPEGSDQMPEHFRQLLDEKAAPGAGAVKSPLDDYREFFEFDIEIQREDPVSKQRKTIGHLSKRLGSGSGGEHRAPLYVIAGAALASAYRLERGKREGIRLILLDEAFNKMDMGNIIATMRYLEDLGLQVIMASPGENLGTLTAFLDRYFDILRDPDRNVIRVQGHDVSEQTRAMFREDLPEFNPALVAEELNAVVPAAMPSA